MDQHTAVASPRKSPTTSSTQSTDDDAGAGDAIQVGVAINPLVRSIARMREEQLSWRIARASRANAAGELTDLLRQRDDATAVVAGRNPYAAAPTRKVAA